MHVSVPAPSSASNNTTILLLFKEFVQGAFNTIFICKEYYDGLLKDKMMNTTGGRKLRLILGLILPERMGFGEIG